MGGIHSESRRDAESRLDTESRRDVDSRMKESAGAGRGVAIDGEKESLLRELLEEHLRLERDLARAGSDFDEEVVLAALVRMEELQARVDAADVAKATEERNGLADARGAQYADSILRKKVLLELLQQIDELARDNASKLQQRLATMNAVLTDVAQKKQFISGYAPTLGQSPRYIDHKR